MVGHVVNRETEEATLTKFLTLASTQPAGLLIEGEAGIGKTTLWLAAVDQARERGFKVLSARAAAAESVLAYAALADLLREVDASVWAELPDPQRIAVDRIMLRGDPTDPASDQRAVAAGFLGVVERILSEGPLVLAIDDLQWLDPSSVQVVSFTARRLSGRAGVLATARVGPDIETTASWLHMARPDDIRRIQVPPLTLGGLNQVIATRYGRAFPRPTMVRIHEISGGNPFYALELARVIDTAEVASDAVLPDTLTELVQSRVGRLHKDVRHVLLAAACIAAPTVEQVALATGAPISRVIDLLEDAEEKGIVGIDGHWVRFAHPLLARGIYTGAAIAQRRSMHRQLAKVVKEPELKARHLALAATTGDPNTLDALDNAAEMARLRGASATAAEFLERALKLDGDTPQRRIRLAGHHFNAGDPGRAQALLEDTIATLKPGPVRAEALALLGFVRLWVNSFSQGAELLQQAVNEAGDNLARRTPMLVNLAFALFSVGLMAEGALRAEDAVADAKHLQNGDLLSQALATRELLRFMCGDGLDEPSLARALELEELRGDMPLAVRACMQKGLMLAWTGQLDPAAEQMLSIRRHCEDRGEESELIYVAFHSGLMATWRGDLNEAVRLADEAMERALQLGDLPVMVALTVRAMPAAYQGRVADARGDVSAALEIGARCGANILAVCQLTTLGFLEVSLGRYREALTTLQPLLSDSGKAPKATEMFLAAFIPDAVEALIAGDQVNQAEVLVQRLERNGTRVDRPWMLAVGARARAMVCAARGDVEGASAAVGHAMAEHERLPMPFERARTQLVVGQLLRRQRHKDLAVNTLTEALSTFEAMGARLWAERASTELARTRFGPRMISGLTPSEQRVAELAAKGMTNRDVAAELFISPKTVEANLSRIYRKLGIHSRAELGGRMRDPDG
ncbi:helix-turn-helix transcriptional regulator [Mycolicibacterium stellerae]|uniref:helix-turn-helix transcriptional regulator n=1 Tax=Mycolicibacterium stellerae TaxID=2358193 RepID=UPI000F0BBE59|nr:LuxR family transcriptional regulator [Mycolicibacterium stellerae]